MWVKNRQDLLSIVGGLFMLFSAGQGWAACVQDAPGADTVAVIDATTGCASVNGQVGCRIDNATGTCTAKDGNGNTLFTATAGLDASGKVNWTVLGGSEYKIDSALVGGATQGNACGYFYKHDAGSATGLGFEKSNGGIANVTYLDLCTDMQKEEAPKPPKVLPSCPQDIQDALDDGTIPGDYAIVGLIHDADAATICFKSGVTVTPCENEQTPTGDSPTCAEIAPLENGAPQGLVRDLTFTGTKVGNNSAVYYCLPPTLTFDGTNSCAWFYY